MVTANRFTLAGLICVAVSMVGSVLLVTDVLFDGAIVAAITLTVAAACLLLWCVAPLTRRATLRRRARPAGNHRASKRRRVPPGTDQKLGDACGLAAAAAPAALTALRAARDFLESMLAAQRE